MAPTIPAADGDVNLYNLANASVFSPIIYYVNGMLTAPRDHAVMASYLSLIIERPVRGVYNATEGGRNDFLQSLRDYTQNAKARLGSHSNRDKSVQYSDAQVSELLADIEKNYTVWNKATVKLFEELMTNRNEMKYIIAHSQGNLITSNALFVMEDLLGFSGLQKVRVFSLASPAPAWPLGLRITNGGGGRQDNAFMNDVVALFRPHNFLSKIGIGGIQNAGDFRTHAESGPVSLDPHATDLHVTTLNFLKSIRADLKLSQEFKPSFLEESAKTAAEAFPL